MYNKIEIKIILSNCENIAELYKIGDLLRYLWLFHNGINPIVFKEIFNERLIELL